MLWPFLQSQGFTEFSDLAAWRKGDRWIDCIQVTTHAMNRDRPRSPWAAEEPPTFSVELGVYYTDRHLLPWANPAPDRPLCRRGESSRLPTSDRALTLARSFPFGHLHGTQFPLANDGADIDRVLGDAFEAIRSRGMAWLNSTHNIDAYLDRVGADSFENLQHDETGSFSEIETADFKAWLESKGVQEGESFSLNPFAEDLPESFQKRLQIAELRDHTAMDVGAPWGDLYYGLLVGSGRWDEAIAALRQDSDPSFADQKYRDIMAVTSEDHAEIKRWASREKAFWTERLRIEREHLAMLESARPGAVEP